MISRRKVIRLLASPPLVGGSFGPTRASANALYSGPPSDHFDGTHFFNPREESPPNSFRDFLRWKITETAEPWPDHVESPFQDVPPRRLKDTQLRVALVGHATFLIQIGGLNILTDPVWSERASPVSFAGPKRYNPPGIAFEVLPRIDVILISHSHYDHLDLASVSRIYDRDRPRIIAPLGNAAIIHADRPDIAVTSVDWGDSVTVETPSAPLNITAEPALHWSARWIGDRNRMLWASYAIQSAGHSVYFAADTGLGSGRNFRDIAAKYPSIDLTLLPIGAYEPRWFMAGQHMNPDEAAEAFALLQAMRAIGFHWGTFRLSKEAADAPPIALAKALEARGIPTERFVAAQPGQAWDIV